MEDPEMMWTPRKFLAVLVTGLGLAASLLVAAGPAHAYGNLSIQYAEFDTDDCHVINGNTNVFRPPSDVRCVVPHSADGSGRAPTYFQPDANAIAVTADFRTSSRAVAWIEFHPYDEFLLVVDTADDGDTIYVEFLVEGDGGGFFDLVGVFRPPGTSAEVDALFRDLSLPDLRQVVLCVYDDASLAELIACYTGVA